MVITMIVIIKQYCDGYVEGIIGVIGRKLQNLGFCPNVVNEIF